MAKHSSSSPAGTSSRSARHAAPGQRERDATQIRDTARAAQRATQTRNATGKPSTVGHAARGAAGGAATGAAIGSVVPGVGTALGAGAGAVVGGAGGAVTGHKAKQEWRRGNQTASRRLLVAEFLVCALIVGLSPVTDKHKSDSMATLMKRASSIAALFLVLGLVSTGGRGAAKLATAFGGLVTVVLLVSDRDVFVKLAAKFNAQTNQSPAGPPDDSEGGGGADGDFGSGWNPGGTVAIEPPAWSRPTPGNPTGGGIWV